MIHDVNHSNVFKNQTFECSAVYATREFDTENPYAHLQSQKSLKDYVQDSTCSTFECTVLIFILFDFVLFLCLFDLISLLICCYRSFLIAFFYF